MSKMPINEVLARNLQYFMDQKALTQAALGEKCGVAQTTISLYLKPDRRKVGASGKAPSAKLSEVEMLANGLGVEVWELLRSMSAEERRAYDKIEQAFKTLQEAGLPPFGELPPGIPTSLGPSKKGHRATAEKKRTEPEKTKDALVRAA